MRHWIAAAVGIVALSCGAAMSEPLTLLYDPFEARSQLRSLGAVASNFMISLVEFQELAEVAKKKFGDTAKATLRGNTGMMEITLDGKVVATSMATARVEEVFGALFVGRSRADDDMARFPFSLSVSGKPGRSDGVGEMVRKRFQKHKPQLFDFDESDWSNLACWSQEAPAVDTGSSKDVRFGKPALCLVRWRRGEGKTMLIGALTADGGRWVSDVSRPICRALAVRWGADPNLRDHTIDYVGCLLVHDPNHGALGAASTVAHHVYEIRPDGELALIN